jgi:hypothetical protein
LICEREGPQGGRKKIPERIRTLVVDLPEVFQRVNSKLLDFAQFLENLSEEDPDSAYHCCAMEGRLFPNGKRTTATARLTFRDGQLPMAN